MSYREEERSRLRRQSSKQAIALAMQGSWREAIAVNEGILKVFPHDVEALNRLGRAHLELGEYREAEETYRRTTEIDAYNTIAVKNLRRLSHLRESAGSAEPGVDRLEPQSFIEEVGKAGVIQLIDLAPAEVVARTAAGDKVEVRPEDGNLTVVTQRGEYLGRVEDQYGQRLIRLMEGGNRYVAAIVSSGQDAVSVIIREVYRDPSQEGRLSFPSRGAGSVRSGIGGRVFRPGYEDEESSGDTGYTVVGGGEEAGILVEESGEADDDGNDEE